MRSELLRLLARLGVVVLLCGFLGHDDRVVGAQSGGVAVRFHGRVTLAAAQVTAAEREAFSPVSRMLLEVVTARNADDVTVCGRAMITVDQPYEVEIPAVPPCVSRTVADPAPQFLFLVNGVQAEAHGRVIVNPNLSAPRTLGASYERDLDVPFGAVVPNAPVFTGGRLIRVRYWGTVALAGRPAPDGTEVRVVTQQGDRVCGTGVVENGLYVVDVPATPGECTHRGPNESTIFLAFVVNGERVIAHGRDIVSPAYIAPDTLAAAYRRDLEGRNPPPADVFAADECNRSPGVQARWYNGEPNEATARKAVVAQEPPSTCIALPGVLRIENGALRRRVTRCIEFYGGVMNRPGAEPVRDVVEALYRQDPAGPWITIEEDAAVLDRHRDLGITVPDISAMGTESPGEAGNAVSARVLVMPGLNASLIALDRNEYFSQVAQLWFGISRTYDYCATLLHELVHALDHITGSLPPRSLECTLSDGTRLKAAEIKAMVPMNAYLISLGRVPNEHYGGRPLPQAAVYPTPATWDRYQSDAGEICR